jgi:hypothetical protein
MRRFHVDGAMILDEEEPIMRKVTFLFGSVLLCLSVTARPGAAVGEISAPSCTESAVLDQSNPAADLEAASEAAGLPCPSEATDVASPLATPIDDLADRAVHCLLIPLCWRNSDCDAGCGGAGLGRCVHNPCPARVCTCR